MMKKLNYKSRAEQLFILLLLCTVCFGAFVLTSCGGKQSCETFKCDAMSEDDGWISGCSIPGCGGCLSSGDGCNSCIWPQSCKLIAGSAKHEDTGTSEKLAALDIRYYGEGCFGCGQIEKSCYSGFIQDKTENADVIGCFYGGDDTEECTIGCFNGCFSCTGTNGAVFQEIYLFEKALKIS